MLHCKNSVQESHYDILSVKEDASYEEIRTGYKSAILNYHPDKLQSTHQTSDVQELQDKFLKVQKAWEILGNSRSRSVYDSELRALRKDTGVGEEDLSLEDMMIEDCGEVVELFYQCRCGDYYSVDSSDLKKMGCTLLRDENKVSFEVAAADGLASVVLPCGSCSLQVRLLLNTGIKVPIDGNNL